MDRWGWAYLAVGCMVALLRMRRDWHIDVALGKPLELEIGETLADIFLWPIVLFVSVCKHLVRRF